MFDPERFYRDAAALPPTITPLPSPIDAGTDHLPDDVVRQNIVLFLSHETYPNEPRRGATSLGLNLGGEDVVSLTSDQAEYVYKVAVASLRDCLGRAMRNATVDG